MKELLHPEKVKIGQHTYVISTIPAFHAQKILMSCVGAFANGGISGIPPDTILEILSYSAVINQNGAEVVLENEGLVEMMVGDLMELIELETRMVEKNFGFLGDGRLKDVLSRLLRAMGGSEPQASEGGTQGT